jgi:hypothetical protein
LCRKNQPGNPDGNPFIPSLDKMLSRAAVVIGTLNLSVLGMSIVHHRTDASLSRIIPANKLEINFANAKILHNNLGGLGPDSGESLILYQNVAQHDGRMVNLKIWNTSDYAGNISKNVIAGDFAQINVAPDLRVKFELSLLDAETGDILVVPRFSISFWDFDAGKDMSGTESLEIGPVDKYFTAEGTELISTEVDDNMWKFTATQRGFGSDNPESLSSLTSLQLSRAVEVEMVMQDRTYLTFGVTPNPAGNFGRNFMMAGPSKLRSEKSHEVGYCSSALAMDFSNPSTGSLAAGDALRISNFAQKGGDSVDLVVKADDLYEAADPSKNGVSGGLLNLNVKGNLTSTFTLSFVKSSTNDPVELSNFFITILDVDSPKYGFEELAVKSADVDHYVLSSNSALKRATIDDMTTFRSSTYGTLENNPTDYDSLTLSNNDRRTVALYFSKSTAEVEIVLKTEEVLIGRNILITGNTPFSCPPA